MNDRLSYEEKKELPDNVFGLPERREYPMPDAAHVRAAEAYFRYCPEDLKRQRVRSRRGEPDSTTVRRRMTERRNRAANVSGGKCDRPVS